jgi:outer membrane murein-binding lipoprotein Lpp
VKDLGKKLVEWAAVAGVLAVAGSYWINTEVERRMKELASNPADAPEVVAISTKVEGLEVAISTKVEGLEAGQARIETKVDAFSSQFLAYLERQAE